MISTSKWMAIKATAHMVKADLLSLPPPQDQCAKDQTKPKAYFQTYHRKEWDAAVEKMEVHQPLLALCASHWKAVVNCMGTGKPSSSVGLLLMGEGPGTEILIQEKPIPTVHTCPRLT